MPEPALRRILVVAGKDPRTQLGGHSSYVRVHARALGAAGYAPHLFCVGPRAERAETGYGVLHVARSRTRPFRQLMIPVHGPRLARSLVAFARREPGPHLFHGFGIWTWSALVAARALARDGIACEVIASAYSTYSHESAGKLRGLDAAHGVEEGLRWRLEHLFTRAVVTRYEHRAYREARRVLVNYASVEKLLADEIGPGLPIRHMPYSIESALDAAPGRAGAEPPAELARLAPAGAPLVVSVSRHDPRKGNDVLLHALAALARRGVAFRAALLSGGRLLEAHRALAGRLGLGERVLLPGWVEDPEAWLRHADVFALPSLEEGSGSLSLLEAMRLGVPGVVSDVDGLPEDVPDGEGALLVPPDRPDALADALARLLADPALRARLGARARERFRSAFGGAGLVRALCELYAELGFPVQEPDPRLGESSGR